ncbi:MAG: amidohydrolase family protein [Phormidesmis sp. FL-bin-119]|nr:amidohydrolase family protein [Pedobacter sp.]
MLERFSRRSFVTGATIAGVGILSGSAYEKNSEWKDGEQLLNEETFRYNVMNDMRSYRKIDSYANALSSSIQADVQIQNADRMQIEKLIVAVPIAKTMGSSAEDIRAYNDIVIKAIMAYPTRILGQFTVNPIDIKTASSEIKRCVDLGMVGMKLFNHVKVNHPSVFSVIEKFIDNRMIIHVHGESQIGVGGYRMKYDVQNNPAISVPEDFVDTAKRYPEAIFQYAHIGGGSDWEYACKSFVNTPNIYVDTGGSNNEERMIDFAVKHLGEDRVLFGCDSSFYQGVGKVLSSGITEAQKRKIFFDNYNRILKKSGNSIH